MEWAGSCSHVILGESVHHVIQHTQELSVFQKSFLNVKPVLLLRIHHAIPTCYYYFFLRAIIVSTYFKPKLETHDSHGCFNF